MLDRSRADAQDAREGPSRSGWDDRVPLWFRRTRAALHGAAVRRLRLTDPIVLLTVAILGASAIVIYLQQRAITEIAWQERNLLENIARQRIQKVSEGVRQIFDGAVLETLFTVSTEVHPAQEMAVIASHFESGYQSYPYVERFFFWNTRTQRIAPDEVLFCRRPGNRTTGPPEIATATGADARFYRSPAVGRQLAQLARLYADVDQRVNYAVVERTWNGIPHQVILRWAWTGSESDRNSFAVSGYMVDEVEVRTRIFEDIFRFPRFVDTSSPGDLFRRLYVKDETGRIVYGLPASPVASRAEAPISMVFFPLSSRAGHLAIQPRVWTLGVVMPSQFGRRSSASLLANGYWLSVGAVLLMLAALGLTIRANRQTVKLAAMKAHLVSNVTHQLRTPLSLINLATETMVLGRIDSPAQLAEYANVVRRETAQLMSLMEKTLEASRVEDARRGYVFEVVDLEKLVGLTVEHFRDRLADREFTIRVQKAGAPLFARLDRGAIEQVLINLLDNAVRYARGLQQIDVRIVPRRRYAAIEVVDYGIGISPEDLPHVFEKFYRGRNNASARSGFGLGLAIVREIVQAHHGKVEVESVPNKGATFRILIRRVMGVAERA